MPKLRAVASIPFLLLLFTSAGCFAPSQEFAIGSDFWNRANPQFLGAAGPVPVASPSPEAAIETPIAPNPGAHKILVGVLDAGVDYNDRLIRKHINVFSTPLESGRSYGVGFDVLGKDFFPSYHIICPSNGSECSNDFMARDHGTHVAQLVTLNDANIGLIPVRVLPLVNLQQDDGFVVGPFEEEMKVNDPEYYADIARRSVDAIASGMEFAVSHGASIINMSLGLVLDELTPTYPEETLARIQEKISSRILTDWKDCLMVVAAGNESRVLERTFQSVPATLELPDLLAVGALGDRQLLANYTNRGRFVDLWVRGSKIASSIPGGRDHMSGTSMSSPIVAHAAAQVKIIDPSLTPAQLRALLLNTADLKLLAFEPSEKADVPTPEPQMVRVLNMKAAREKARELLVKREAREIWLTPPYTHGNAR